MKKKLKLTQSPWSILEWKPSQWSTRIGRYALWVELEGKRPPKWGWHVCGPNYDADGQALSVVKAMNAALNAVPRPKKRRKK